MQDHNINLNSCGQDPCIRAVYEILLYGSGTCVDGTICTCCEVDVFSALVVYDITLIRVYSYHNLAVSLNKLVDQVQHNEL